MTTLELTISAGTILYVDDLLAIFEEMGDYMEECPCEACTTWLMVRDRIVAAAMEGGI